MLRAGLPAANILGVGMWEQMDTLAHYAALTTRCPFLEVWPFFNPKGLARSYTMLIVKDSIE